MPKASTVPASACCAPANKAGFAQRLLSLALRRFARMQTHLVLLGRMTREREDGQLPARSARAAGVDEIVNLPMQRNDIADYLGLTFETVSQGAARAQGRALIRLSRSIASRCSTRGALACLAD